MFFIEIMYHMGNSFLCLSFLNSLSGFQVFSLIAVTWGPVLVSEVHKEPWSRAVLPRTWALVPCICACLDMTENWFLEVDCLVVKYILFCLRMRPGQNLSICRGSLIKEKWKQNKTKSICDWEGKLSSSFLSKQCWRHMSICTKNRKMSLSFFFFFFFFNPCS